MTPISIPFGGTTISAMLPAGCDILCMPKSVTLENPSKAILNAVAKPIGTKPLAKLAEEKLAMAAKAGRTPTACIVISDNTRPVPYRGQGGVTVAPTAPSA